MTLASKQRVVAAGLLLLALWPLAHRALVARFGLSPWRLFGWAMYCAPRLPLQVAVSAVSGPEHSRHALTGVGDRLLSGAIVRLSARRATWGTLAAPDAVAAAALAASPESDTVEVEIERLYLDPRTARIASQRQVYAYPRR